MIDEADCRRLARFFAGECTEEERRATEAWLDEAPSRREEAEQLRALWRVSAVAPWVPNSEAAWTRLAARVHVNELKAPIGLIPARSTPARGTFRWQRASSRLLPRLVLGGAALAAAVALGFVLAEDRDAPEARPQPIESPEREFRTARGQHAVIVLGDGSRVELGAASVLRVRESDAGRRVVVQLEGQAVFDVVHDSLRLFEVRSANAITEDLGTRFTVRAYRGESRVQVFVASGKVALRAVGAPSSSGTLLGPNDLGVLDSIGRTTVRNGVDSTGHLAWTRDRFVFQNALLRDVLSDIARWFDVEIVAEPSLLEQRITMNVPARSLSDVVGAITTPLRLRSVKRGSTIVLQQ